MIEQLTREAPLNLYEASPLVYEIPRIGSDYLARQRAAELIGIAALQVVTENPEQADPAATLSLMDAIHRAQNGEPEARNLIAQNVHSDLVERALKAGHITEVELEVNSKGEVVQYGQTDEQIQLNSLKFTSRLPQVRARNAAETRNMFRIRSVLQQDLLEENVLLVASPAADDMSEEQAAEIGHFVDTMSCSFQVTTKNPHTGKITTQSAFVAGKKDRNAERQDIQIITKLGERLGVDFRGKTACEILDTPLLIPKSFMKNGVIDIVWLYDELAGGTFFGQDKPRQDYATYPEICRQREAKFKPMVDDITNELISQGGDIKTPQEATRRLNKLSAASLLRRAVTDTEIDANVFGIESATYLESARRYHELGKIGQMERFLSLAKDADRSYSCPGGVDDTDASESANKGENDDCEFISRECPLCGAKNVHTIVKKLSSGKRQIKGSCGCSKES